MERRENGDKEEERSRGGSRRRSAKAPLSGVKVKLLCSPIRIAREKSMVCAIRRPRIIVHNVPYSSKFVHNDELLTFENQGRNWIFLKLSRNGNQKTGEVGSKTLASN